MTRARWLGALVLAAVVAGSVFWARGVFWAPRAPRPNVILITIDTMRPDRISAYGYTKHVTPNLDRLAREGALFENAFCDVTWTTPSMASVMTGKYATRHGMRSSFQTLKPEATTLAEILRDQGMETAAIVGSYPVHSIFGLNQGFGLYDENFDSPIKLNPGIDFGPQPPIKTLERPAGDDTETTLRWFLLSRAQSDAYRSDTHVSDRVIAWLKQERREPFFLWVHYFGPHEKPTGLTGVQNIGAEQQIQLAAYDHDVLVTDTEIGRVLDELDTLGIADRTNVIVHADHGQSLGQHDYFGHGRNVYDPTQRIPLIVRAPERIQAGRRESNMARNVDVFATVLDLLNLPDPEPGDGKSLLRPNEGIDESVYVETYLSAASLFAELVDPKNDTHLGFRRLGLRTSKWKFIINDPIPFVDQDQTPLPDEVHRRYYFEELYDLSTDPGETVNRVREQPAVADTLRRKIVGYQSLRPTSSKPMAMDDTTREKLKALGYLAE